MTEQSSTSSSQILPYAFIVSLFNTLSTISSRAGNAEEILEQSATDHDDAEAEPTEISRKKKSRREIPHDTRSILLTLHVLFPHVLLDALDLLDRGCVVRLVVLPEEDDQNENANRDTLNPVYESGENISTSGPSNQATDKSEEQPVEASVVVADPFTVASGSGRKRKRDDVSSVTQRELKIHHITHHVLSARPRTYNSSVKEKSRSKLDEGQRRKSFASDSHSNRSQHVHLSAWNCSCPAFAIAAAFADADVANSDLTSASPTAARYLDMKSNVVGSDSHTLQDGHSKPIFGGLNLYRRVNVSQKSDRGTDQRREPASVPPVCKHLLACFLGELCPELFGPVSRSERRTGGRRDRDDDPSSDVSTDLKSRCGMREVTVTMLEAAGIAGAHGGIAAFPDIF